MLPWISPFTDLGTTLLLHKDQVIELTICSWERKKNISLRSEDYTLPERQVSGDRMQDLKMWL